MEIDRTAARLARAQYGAFSRAQLAAAGHAGSTIDRARRRGGWRNPDSGVYLLPSHRRSWEQRAMAATLGQPGSALAGRSAAALWGIGNVARRGPIEIVVPPGSHHGSRLAAVRRSEHRELRRTAGIPVSSPALTAVQLASVLETDRLGRVVDDSVRDGLCRLDHLGDWAVRATRARLPGVGRLRAVLHERGEGHVPPESELEVCLFQMLDAAGIPPVDRQVRLPWRGGAELRVDGVLRGWPIIVEGDGRAWHARLEQMESDRERDRIAVAHGYIPMRFSWLDLTERAERSRQQVRDAGRAWTR